MEHDIEPQTAQRIPDTELKAIFLNFIQGAVQEQKQAVYEMPSVELESASVFQKRPWPSTMPKITAEELRVMPTSKHVEHKKTVSPTWAQATAKIVPKKARSSVAPDMEEPDFGAVITTPDLGVVGNHKKPNKGLVIAADDFSVHPSMKKMAQRAKRDCSVPQAEYNTSSMDVDPAPQPLDRSAFSSVPQEKTVPVAATLPDRLPFASEQQQHKEHVQEAPRIPDMLYSRGHTGFFKSDTDVKVSRSEKGQMMVVTNDTGSGRERAAMRSGTPQDLTQLYKLNYSVEGLKSVLAGLEQHNMATNTAIFAAELKHLAELSNSGEHIPVMTDSVLDGKKIPNDVVIPMKVIRNFLRAPSSRERECVATHLCIGRQLNILNPFTLVSFYILSRTAEDCVSELTPEQAEQYRTSRSEAHRDLNGMVSAPPSFCILCILNKSQFKVRRRTITRDTKVPPKRQLYPPVSVSVNVNGEFRNQDCCGPVSGKYKGIVSHVPIVNDEHFVEGVSMEIDGESVRSLRWLVPEYQALISRAHFQQGPKCT